MPEEINEQELQPITGPKNKLTLIDSPISQPQLLQVLQRTPAQHVHKRPAKGGGQWDYVTGVYVKKVLNYVFGWLWDFEIVDKGEVKAGNKIVQLWVQGKLTIKDPKTFQPIIVKTQFGGADVKYMRSNANQPLDYANDLKSASTDALKKCAAELGIASDIYGKNEFKEIKQNATPAQKPKQQTQADYLKQLNEVLEKKGAKTEQEKVELYNKVTGENIKSLKIAQSTAQKYIINFLNSPMAK